MPRFESGNRFWEVWLDGRTVLTRQGARSGEGRLTRKVFPSAQRAAREMDKRIATTLSKGYRRITPELSEALPEDHVQAILAAPDDDGSYLVFADALLTEGHPRGELIMLQHARDDGNAKPARLKRGEAQLFEEHPEMALPPRFSEALRKAKRKDKAPSGYCHATWRCGFLRSATVGRNSARPLYSVRELLHELLGAPSARFLTELTVGALGVKDDYDYSGVMEALLVHRPMALRSLHLADFDAEEHSAPSRALLGDLGRLGEAAPSLERLVLHGGRVTLEGLALAQLRELDVQVLVDRELLTQLLGCLPGLPRLERLTLAGVELDDELGDQLREAAPRLAALKQLDLRRNRLGETICERLDAALPRADLAEQRERTSGALSLAQVRDAASDARSLTAARGLVAADRWESAGRAPEALWGRFYGSHYTYIVHVATPALESVCSCPSRNLPCKHALALMLRAVDGELPEAPVPVGHRDDAARDPW